MAQPVGLVVEPVVLNRLGIFPESATTVLADWQHGVALRLVVAPRGESSGHLTFPLEPMTTVDGRPMLAALQMLLGPDRLFEGGSSATRLKPLLAASRREQNEVSTRLAEQVLEALWILVKDFDAAGAPPAEPQHIYGGLITVLLRLVFLLYAKDQELMPTDTRYDQHYSVGGLAQCLRQDRADHQNAMEGPGAWATLMGLFRLVYDGGGSSEAYLPARLAICSIRRLTPSWKAARQTRPTPMGRWCPVWAGPSRSAAFNTATGR